MIRSAFRIGSGVLALSLAAIGSSAKAVELFHDDFDVAGTKLDLTKWTTEFGPPSFLGRTQLRDWVRPGGVGQFVVTDGQAHLDLNTFNPTGFSFYGTHAKTLASFMPGPDTDVLLSVRMRLTTVQPGLVFGIYLLGCDAGPCATAHDELDFELVTNFVQTGSSPLRVQLNRYAAEPLGAGHGPIVALPANFDTLAYHEWQISWGKSKVTYSVDGTDLFTATDFIPQGSMRANLIAWAPAPEWPDGYHASIQPTGNAALDQTLSALVDSVSVQAVPEPAEWLTLVAGVMAIAARVRRYRMRGSR